jgi:NADH:ubiquinone oxidoreductase subunit 6 (subunit J)
MPWLIFRALQEKVTLVALGLLVLLLPAALLRRQDLPCLRMLELFVIVMAVLPANALVCAVISSNDPRYQGRVAWLIVLLAVLFAVVLLQQQRRLPHSQDASAAPRA